MAKRCKDIPDECWEIIFNKLGHHSNLQALTLVCKRFLFIISHIRTTFNLTVPAILTHGDNLSSIFNRFPRIKSIDLRQAGDSTPRLLHQIASSSLKIQSLDVSQTSLSQIQLLGQKMKSLRVLKCSEVTGLSNENLVVIANSVPWVEELDISYPQNHPTRYYSITDIGIEMLCSKMKGLRKINISGNQHVTDKSLMALSSNCVFLEQVVAKNCAMVTFAGIQFLVRNCPNLASLAVSDIDFKTPTDCFSCAKSLSTLDIEDAGVSDEFLYSLSVSGIPLKSFTLSHCDGLGHLGLVHFLKTYPLLECLCLTNVDFDDNTFIVQESSNYLSNLTAIKLHRAYQTESSFFMLAKNCPLLEDIDLSGDAILGSGDGTDFVSNPRIRSLHLSCNRYLRDESFAKLAIVCPFLEKLRVSSCNEVTENGISTFLNRCSSIRHLEISGCERIKNIGKGNSLPKLEALSVEDSGIDDEGLAMIGKRCRELLNLNLAGCSWVSNEGCKNMLEGCRRLREINLSQCVNVGVEIIDWMVFSTPSLRKIISPSSSYPDVCQMQFYLRHGCYVWTPPADDDIIGRW